MCDMFFHHCEKYKKSNSLMVETFICFQDQRFSMLSLASCLVHCSSACKKVGNHGGVAQWSRDALLRLARK